MKRRFAHPGKQHPSSRSHSARRSAAGMARLCLPTSSTLPALEVALVGWLLTTAGTSLSALATRTFSRAVAGSSPILQLNQSGAACCRSYSPYDGGQGMDVLLVDSGLKVVGPAFFVRNTGGWGGMQRNFSSFPRGVAEEGVPELPAQCGR